MKWPRERPFDDGYGNRGGWAKSPSRIQEDSGPEERFEAGFSRVESLEVLEQGHPELERYRDAEGHIYFYDIGATLHPSFSVNGFLVHNSSILKGWDRSTCKNLIDSFSQTPYRLSCSATPAPNDYLELGTQAEFLGVMSRAEMLATFFIHDGELARVLRPGRLVAIHCMNLPSLKERDGFIGLKDFRGDIIRAMQHEGFIYHSEVCIWKDPVTAMQRTKAIGLLYKQLRKDSTMSRQGIPDYLVVFRKDGSNAEPVTKTHESFSVDRWQKYASPVWMDINPSDTLQRESAREQADERHVCPLQLQVIERAIELWTNPDDLVLSPFGGIGSEGYQAIKMGRQFVGVELKYSYWKQAVANLGAAETAGKEQHSLFADA